MKNAFIITYVIILLLLPANRMDLVFSTSQVTTIKNLDDSYQLREDQYDLREEGIKSDRRQAVTSDRIALLSATIATDVLDSDSLPTVIHLGIYANRIANPDVSISYDPLLYYVNPIRDKWGPGFDVFSWPTEIMKRNLIPSNDLYARAVQVRQAERIIFPVCLYSQDVPGSVQQYKFVISPLRNMQVQYWIINANTEEIVVTGPRRNVREDDNLNINWICRDAQGKIVPDGDFVLKIRGSFRDRLGRRRFVDISYQFLHKGNLSE